MTVTLETFPGSSHDDFVLWSRGMRDRQVDDAYAAPRIRLYDGNLVYAGTVCGEVSSSSTEIVNEVGTIQIVLPISNDDDEAIRRTWAAHWALDEDARGTSNIHVIWEYNGIRRGGRMNPQSGLKLIEDDQGDRVELTFLDDMAELQNVMVASNPFLPLSLAQIPKAWMVYAPADYALLVTFAFNLFRLNLTNFNVSADPMNPDTWDYLLWAQSQIVVKPRMLGDSTAPMALVVGSIKTSIYDVAAPVLEDAELQWDLQRWLTGDPEPWPGAGTNWRNGTLFVDIVDKSGFRNGTVLGGNALTGMVRTFADLTGGQVEDSYDLFTGAPISDTEFRNPLYGLFTHPQRPHVVYRAGDISGIQSSEFNISPGGAGRITVGGQSMPGVNALISAAVQYGGDVLGDNLGVVIGVGLGVNVTVGSLGGALDAFLKPIYSDTILAYMSIPLLLRVARQGWGHYLETSSTNVTQAFTPAGVMDLRARRRETDPDTGFTFAVTQCAPWIIGGAGHGDWACGDRVGGTSRYLMPRVWVRRCRSLQVSSDRDGVKIDATMGDLRPQLEALDRMIALINKAMGGLQQIGLFG